MKTNMAAKMAVCSVYMLQEKFIHRDKRTWNFLYMFQRKSYSLQRNHVSSLGWLGTFKITGHATVSYGT